MRISAKLRELHAPTRAACESHPFVLGMADGTLPLEYFQRWVAQDWLYLQGYLQIVQRAADLTTDEDTRARWLEMVRLTRDVELDLHRGLARDVGLSEDDLAQTAPYPATTRYLQTLAAADTYHEVVATLTPCAVGYAEIAKKLGAMPKSPVPRYAEWIATYLDPSFQEVVPWLEAELDICSDGHEEAVSNSYAAAAQLELDFWDALYAGPA